ncbi:MAG TPA: MFS transporter [Clostridia bacterium]|nr:MFS transporter [Clostridia bacterium]
MNYISNVWKLYALRFFHGLIPAYVIERLFWEQRGMTVQMVVYTEIIYALTVVVLEIPTGVMADRWGRKGMLRITAFLSCCEFFILANATSFVHFAAAVFLSGIGHSAGSGSESALLYDSLLTAKKEKDFEKHLGRMNVFDYTAIIIASLSGSLLAAHFGFDLNYQLSVISSVIALLISFTLKEPVVRSEADRPKKMKDYISISFGFFKNNPSVCLVLLAGMVTGAVMNFPDEFWQLYLERLNIPVNCFGLFLTLYLIARLPGNILVTTLKSRFGYRALLTAVIFILAAGFLCLSAANDYMSLVILVLIALVSGVIEPLVSGYLHHRIDSSVRATLDSFQSLGMKGAVILTGLGFGFVSSRFDVFGGSAFLALICICFLIFFRIYSKRIEETGNMTYSSQNDKVG